MVRRSLVFVVAALVSLALAGRASAQNPPAATTPTLDEIIAKNLDAKGGLPKLKSVQTIKQTSKMTMQGMEATLTVYSKRPNLLRQEVAVAGQTVINAFDGQRPWAINPLSGSTRPIELSGPMADTIREQSSFEGPLVDYKAKGFIIDLVGAEALGDRTVYHLKLTTPSKQINHLYIDAATGLEAKLTTEVDATTKFDQEFSDYRDVEGVKVPFLIKTLSNGVLQSEIRVQAVQLNVPVDDAMFRMPKGF